MLEWSDRAACIGADIHLFYPQLVAHVPPAAAALCGSCPVSCQCLQWAIVNEADGVWGGTSAVDRDDIRDRVARGDATIESVLAELGCDPVDIRMPRRPLRVSRRRNRRRPA